MRIPLLNIGVSVFTLMLCNLPTMINGILISIQSEAMCHACSKWRHINFASTKPLMGSKCKVLYVFVCFGWFVMCFACVLSGCKFLHAFACIHKCFVSSFARMHFCLCIFVFFSGALLGHILGDFGTPSAHYWDSLGRS